jgi:hypothetical protein
VARVAYGSWAEILLLAGRHGMGRTVLGQEAVGNKGDGLQPGRTNDSAVGTADDAVAQIGDLDGPGSSCRGNHQKSGASQGQKAAELREIG